MTTLIIVRHGETDWNVEGRWQGQIDVPLNANGHHQAQLMAEFFSPCPYHGHLFERFTSGERNSRVPGQEIRFTGPNRCSPARNSPGHVAGIENFRNSK